jgi:hypothetical protein
VDKRVSKPRQEVLFLDEQGMVISQESLAVND